MKKIYFYFLFIALISCNSKKDAYLISNDSAGLLKIGMDINDAKKLFSDCKFETVDLTRFGLDGGDSGILVKNLNEKLVVFWTNSEQKKVNGIICLGSKYHTKQGIKPKMTIGDLKKLEPNLTIQINSLNPDHEFIVLENESMYLDFLSTDKNRIGKYKLNDPEESVSDMRSNARIDNIWIKEK